MIVLTLTYEQLVHEAYINQISVYEEIMKPRIKGLYSDNIIWINKSIFSITEKKCVLGEELGHHYTSSGDILEQNSIVNRKQELRARRWAYNKLVPLEMIIVAHKSNVANKYELADFLNVTEEFLNDAVQWYISKYGLSASIEGYTICFEPLGVLEMFDFIEKAI